MPFRIPRNNSTVPIVRRPGHFDQFNIILSIPEACRVALLAALVPEDGVALPIPLILRDRVADNNPNTRMIRAFPATTPDPARRYRMKIRISDYPDEQFTGLRFRQVLHSLHGQAVTTSTPPTTDLPIPACNQWFNLSDFLPDAVYKPITDARLVRNGYPDVVGEWCTDDDLFWFAVFPAIANDGVYTLHIYCGAGGATPLPGYHALEFDVGDYCS